MTFFIGVLTLVMIVAGALAGSSNPTRKIHAIATVVGFAALGGIGMCVGADYSQPSLLTTAQIATPWAGVLTGSYAVGRFLAWADKQHIKRVTRKSG